MRVRLLLLPSALVAGILGCGDPTVAADGGMDGSMPDAADASTDAGMDAVKDALMDVESQDSGLDSGIGIGSIAGLVAWLDAAKGITKDNQGAVTKWLDQTSNANHAVSQAPPTWVASSIHMLPALHFGGFVMLSIPDASSLQFGTGDFLVEIVSRFSNDPTGNTPVGSFCQKYTNGSTWLSFTANDFNMGNPLAGLAGSFDLNNAVVQHTALNDGMPRSYGFRRFGMNSATFELRINGMSAVMKQQTQFLDVSGVGNDLQIGASLVGDIAEVVIVKGSISNGDLSTIETYLKTKYAL